MERKNLKFTLKTVTEKKSQEGNDELEEKEGCIEGVRMYVCIPPAYNDGISQENLVLGTDTLVIPLMRIINSSISTRIVPEKWKEAIFTPILKKGDAKKKENYRLVSCLKVAPKVMERKVSTGEWHGIVDFITACHSKGQWF